jgi:hypothetical protein
MIKIFRKTIWSFRLNGKRYRKRLGMKIETNPFKRLTVGALIVSVNGIVQQHWPGTLAFDPVVGIFRKSDDLLVKRYKWKYRIVKMVLIKNDLKES